MYSKTNLRRKKIEDIRKKLVSGNYMKATLRSEFPPHSISIPVSALLK